MNKTAIGDYLGEKHDFNEAVLKSFVELHDFTDIILVESLRQFLWSFRLPGKLSNFLWEVLGKSLKITQRHIYSLATLFSILKFFSIWKRIQCVQYSSISSILKFSSVFQYFSNLHDSVFSVFQ